MLVTLLLKPRQLFERQLLSVMTSAPSGSMSSDDTDLMLQPWFAFRLCVVLTMLLTTLIVLFEIESIEIVIAIFSIGVSSTSLLLRLLSASTAMGSPLPSSQDEVAETLEALGMAGVGTLVVLYLLN